MNTMNNTLKLRKESTLKPLSTIQSKEIIKMGMTDSHENNKTHESLVEHSTVSFNTKSRRDNVRQIALSPSKENVAKYKNEKPLLLRNDKLSNDKLKFVESSSGGSKNEGDNLVDNTIANKWKQGSVRESSSDSDKEKQQDDGLASPPLN